MVGALRTADEQNIHLYKRSKHCVYLVSTLEDGCDCVGDNAGDIHQCVASIGGL